MRCRGMCWSVGAGLLAVSLPGLALADDVSPAPAAPSVPTTVPATVHVRLATPGATLYAQPEGNPAIVATCQAPCDADVPVSDALRIKLQGATSRPFTLAAEPGQSVKLVADPPTTAGVVLGGGLVVAGGLAVVVGGLVAVSSCALYASGLHDSGDTCATGFAVFGGGVAGVVLGSVAVVNSLKTTVVQSPPTSSQSASREPMWQPTTASPPFAVPAAVVMPLVSRRF